MVEGAEYGNRTRLPGLGSPCTTDVLIPRIESDKRADCLGADTRTRTEDLRITNALLYQLSHIGNCGAKVRQFCGIPKCLARYFSKNICCGRRIPGGMWEDSVVDDVGSRRPNRKLFLLSPRWGVIKVVKVV